MMLDLGGKTFLVMGAGEGIGAAVSEGLAAGGGDVCCLDIDLARARRVADRVNGQALACDVTVDEQLTAAFDEAVSWKGKLDGVVDIIGGSRGAWLLDQSVEGVAREIEFNLTHKFAVLRHAARHLREGSTISFVSSVSGIMSLPRQTAYGAAKAALQHLVAGAAAELGHRGIRVNAVAPGFVRTPRMLERFSAAQWDEIAAETPLQRPGEVSEIADVLLFLSSPMSSFVTGQTIVADGGLTLPLKVMRAGSEGQIRGNR